MKYQQVVFMQESEAIKAIDILERKGAEAAFDLFLNWYCGDFEEETDTPPWGLNDQMYSFGEYVMSVNYRLPYIGICKVIE